MEEGFPLFLFSLLSLLLRKYCITTFFVYHVFVRSLGCTYLSPTFSVRPRSSVGRVTVDLIRRSWVRFPPRSKDFFFASCGSLFPFIRANALWVIHGFKLHFNLHFRVNSLFHHLCSQCYAAQHSYLISWSMLYSGQ